MHNMKLGNEQVKALSQSDELPGVNPDATKAFEEHVIPHLQRVIDECDRHNIPMLSAFQMSPGTGLFRHDGACFSIARVKCDKEGVLFGALNKLVYNASPGLKAREDALVGMAEAGAELKERADG